MPHDPHGTPRDSRLLALDFDGVIADSAPECFTVACATWRSLEPESRLLAPGAEPLRDAFMALMPLGNRAEDFGIALRILAEGASVASQAEYDAFRETLEPAWLRAFHKRFYRERAALAAADREAWLRQMGPYPPVVSTLRRLSGRIELAIATAKDRRTVRILLGEYGISDLFASGRVLDKETGASKANHMERLRDELGVSYEAITFIDDKLNHLDAVAGLGVRCVLAGWGYNGAREVELARARGYPVWSPADLEAGVFA